MKFLICGIGSAGQRHYKNLQRLGHKLAVFRSRKTMTQFIKEFFDDQKTQRRTVKIFYDLSEALKKFKPDALVIANPTSLHMPVAMEGARARCHLFIEKPLSDDLRETDYLGNLASRNDLKIMVGYNLRFHPLLQEMKRMYEDGVIGKALWMNVEMGECIEDWHPWEDYRHSYAAKKSGGGGSVLAFSHDIDYLYWFFGMPKKILACGGKITPLELEVEDVAKTVMEFRNCALASLHLDYWQRPPRRKFEISGEKGMLIWDYYEKSLLWQNRNKQHMVFLKSVETTFERNEMFVAEMENFIEAIEHNRKPLIDLGQGIEVLKICLAIKKQLSI